MDPLRNIQEDLAIGWEGERSQNNSQVSSSLKELRCQ